MSEVMKHYWGLKLPLSRWSKSSVPSILEPILEQVDVLVIVLVSVVVLEPLL